MRPPHWALRLYAAMLDRRMRRAIANPTATQDRLLANMLATYRDTELGRSLKLDQVRSVADFRRLVPVTDESYYRPFLERVLATNEPGIVSPERLEHIARSSGTTSKTYKLVPYPKAQIASYRRFETKVPMHTMRDLANFSLLDSQILITAGNPTVETTPQGLTLGYGTGIMTLHAPSFARSFVRPTRDVLEMDDWEAKLEATVRQAYPLDIRVMTGVPIFAVQVLERLMAYARAQGSSARTVSDIWPNLAVYYWSGSPLTLYEARMRELFGPQVHFRELFTCTEGPLGYQYRDGEPGLLLDLENTYFEFQPADAPLDAPRLGFEAVEVGKPYRMLMSTWAGFFAYRLGDLVEFVSTDPPLVVVKGRELDEINLGYEHLQYHVVQAALDDVAAEQGVTIANFFVGPDGPQGGDRQSYHWYLEFTRPPADAQAFVETVDRTLQARHKLYAGMRHDDLVLQGPKVTVLPTGTIDRYVLDTRQFGQGKFLHLYSSRAVPEAILAHARREA